MKAGSERRKPALLHLIIVLYVYECDKKRHKSGSCMVAQQGGIRKHVLDGFRSLCKPFLLQGGGGFLWIHVAQRLYQYVT